MLQKSLKSLPELISQENKLKFLNNSCSHNKNGEKCFCNILKIKTSNLPDFLESKICALKEFRFLEIDRNLQFEKLLQTQMNNRFCNENALNLKDRQTAIQLMQAFTADFGFCLKTFSLALACFDVILAKFEMEESQIKLVVCVTLFLAAKMEEKEGKLPSIKKCVFLLGQFFNEKEFYDCEKFVFESLGLNLNIKTPFNFLCFFANDGILCEKECLGKTEVEKRELSNGLGIILIQLHELTSYKYDFYRFTSIAVAATIISLARVLLGFPKWNQNLEKMTHLTENSLVNCFQLLTNAYQDFQAKIKLDNKRDSLKKTTFNNEFQIKNKLTLENTASSGLEEEEENEEEKKVLLSIEVKKNKGFNLFGNKNKKHDFDLRNRTDELKMGILNSLKEFELDKNVISGKQFF